MPHYRERGPYRHIYYDYPMFYHRPRYFIVGGNRFYDGMLLKRGPRRRYFW